MLNKKMMKKNGAKAIAAIMVAATMMSTVTPALAAENEEVAFVQEMEAPAPAVVEEAPAPVVVEEVPAPVVEEAPQEIVAEEAPVPAEVEVVEMPEEAPAEAEVVVMPEEVPVEAEVVEMPEEAPAEAEVVVMPEEALVEAEAAQMPEEEVPAQTENADVAEADAQDAVQAVADGETEEAFVMDEHQMVSFMMNSGEFEEMDKSEIEGHEKEIAEQDKKAQEAIDKKEQETEKKINDASAVAGKLAVKIINTDYSDSQKAAEDIAKTTLQLVNQNFVKNIPYVGGFMKEVISGISGEPSEGEAMAAQFKDINDRLDKINSTIENCTGMILKKEDAERISNKAGGINQAANDLNKFYDKNNDNFKNALEALSGKSDYCGMQTVQNTFDSIYTADELSYLNAYNGFVNKIINKDEFLQDYEAFGGKADIFDIYGKILTDGGLCNATFLNERKAMTDQVEEYCNTGYDVLKTTMTIYLAQQQNIRTMCDTKIKELNSKLAEATDADEISRINAEIDSYKEKWQTSNNNVVNTDRRLTTLENHNTLLLDCLKKERDAIKNDEDILANAVRNEEVEVNHNMIKKEVIQGKMGYPELSEDGCTITYKDFYGNVLGKRTVEKEYKKVDQYDVECGKVYKIQETITGAFWTTKTKTMEVRVTKVTEEPGKLWGTNRTIETVDINTGEKRTFTLGFWGETVTVLERRVSGITK